MSGNDENVDVPRAIVIVLLLLASLFVFLPYKGKQNYKDLSACQKQFYSQASCFAAGMLLAIATVHILPEANAMWNSEKHDDHETLNEPEHSEHAEEAEKDGHAFPLPFVLMLVGFCIMLFMDQVLFKQTNHKHAEVVKAPT